MSQNWVDAVPLILDTLGRDKVICGKKSNSAKPALFFNDQQMK
jgi:hypothetical protein